MYEIKMPVSALGRVAERTFCEENFLSIPTLYQVADLKKNLYQALEEIGFVPGGNRGGRMANGCTLLGGLALNTNSEVRGFFLLRHWWQYLSKDCVCLRVCVFIPVCLSVYVGCWVACLPLPAFA